LVLDWKIKLNVLEQLYEELISVLHYLTDPVRDFQERAFYGL